MYKYLRIVPFLGLLMFGYGCKKETTPFLLDSLAGYYTYYGTIQSGNVDTVYPAQPTDGASTIKNGGPNTLVFNGVPLLYDSLNYNSGNIDTVNDYVFNVVNCCGYEQIVFPKSHSDSIFVTILYSNNPASWTITSMKGKKSS